MEFGPVQMLVLEFDPDRLSGEILPELQRLFEQGLRPDDPFGLAELRAPLRGEVVLVRVDVAGAAALHRQRRDGLAFEPE